VNFVPRPFAEMIGLSLCLELTTDFKLFTEQEILCGFSLIIISIKHRYFNFLNHLGASLIVSWQQITTTST